MEGEILKPEDLQQKLYFLVEELQTMAKELSPTFQQRVSCELLSELANSLLNDTVFEIVKGLMEIQHVTEKHLAQERNTVLKRQRDEMLNITKEISCPKHRKIKLGELHEKHKKEITELDKKIILYMDEKVADQQSTLRLAGVPGFSVTKNATDIQLQMHLLDFILRLASKQLKFNKK